MLDAKLRVKLLKKNGVSETRLLTPKTGDHVDESKCVNDKVDEM